MVNFNINVENYLKIQKLLCILVKQGTLSILTCVSKRLKLIQKAKPPAGAPPRTDMPVIEPKKGEMPKMKNLLQKGKIDVREPYA